MGYNALLIGTSEAYWQNHFSLSWVLSSVLIIVCSVSVNAGTLADIRSRGVLRVGISGDYQPFSLCAEDFTNCHGFDVDMARRAALALGVQVSFVRFRWPDLQADLAAGKFDVAMSGVTIRPERVLTATFTRPYAFSGAVVVVADFTKLSTLASVNRPQIRLAVNAGGHLENVARLHFPSATIVPTAKNLSLPDLVEQQQADALLTDSLEAPHFLAAHPMLKALPSFGCDRKAYLLRRTNAAVREWFDQWLQAQEVDGSLPALRSQWFGQNTAVTPHKLALLLALLDMRLALMPAVADYKRRYTLPIEDRQQEQAVLERVAMQARTYGGNVATLQHLFQVQMELAKKVQHVVVQGRTQDFLLPAWARNLDLVVDLRPALQELSDRLLQESIRMVPVLQEYALVERLTDTEITIPGLSSQDKQRLAHALSQVRQEQ